MDYGEYIEGATDGEIADWLADALGHALYAGDGEVTIAVPGGSTPFPIFRNLAKRDLDFGRLVIWPTDDRIVPEDHPASNTGKIRSIFEPLGAKIQPLDESVKVPEFKLVWLGMGNDGHIASLFPNTHPDPDDDQHVRRITPDPLPPEAPFDRITLTIPALLNCDDMIFVIRGKEKRDVFKAADASNNDLPIARLLEVANFLTTPRITCFV